MSDDQSDVTILDSEGKNVMSMQTTGEERLLAMLIYLTSFFTTIIGPLIIWLLKRGDSAFIDYHGKEYLNFVISYAIYGIAAGISVALLIGIVLVPVVAIAGFVLTIVAAIKAYNGEMYRIPWIFRLF